MAASNYRVRRATLDDREGLKALWISMRLPAPELEPRLTEFQVVEGANGQIIGAAGIQISRQQGWLHSESFRDFSVADDARTLLLERIRSLCSNHGVLRLWTQEKAPFWSQQGFQPAGAEDLKKLPETWTGSDWLTLQLKDEAAFVSMEKELALFMESEKQRTVDTLQRVQVMKSVFLWAGVVLGVFVLGAVIYVFMKNPKILPLGR